MKLTRTLIACGVMLWAGSGAPQAGQGAADPITGTWTGHMARIGGGDRQNITVALKLDGTSVTGTITGPPRPGEIRTGTFDQATGALRFEVVVQDDAKSVAVFEGTVAQGSATGKLSLNGGSGTFSMTKDARAAAASGASPADSDDTMAAIRRSFAEVSEYVTKAAALVPADKYTYRPADSVRTFGQMIGHIADGYTYYCAAAAGRKVQWTDAIEKGRTEKAAIVEKLGQATEACKAAHGGPADAGALVGNIAHTNLHYGNLVTYIRMLGLVPPSS